MRSSRFFLAGAFAIAAIIFFFADETRQTAYNIATRDMFVSADTDNFDPGPAIGSDFPGLNARYHNQTISLLTPFAGTEGTLLVALRSVDWCPFCMKQLIQLQQHRAGFDAAGLGLVAITYDDPQTQQRFIDKRGITIPLLSDIDAISFKTLGILNREYQPGDEHYGIPYPGVIIVDRHGKVAGKLFVEAYSSRVDAASTLAYARRVLGSGVATP